MYCFRLEVLAVSPWNSTTTGIQPQLALRVLYDPILAPDGGRYALSLLRIWDGRTDGNESERWK